MVWNKQIQRDTRKSRLKGGLIFGLTVFLSVSLWSYHPEDPSLNSFGLSLKVLNYCGFIGASLADLFYQLFGLSSWFVVLGGLWLSYKLFTNRLSGPLLNSLLVFGLFLLSFSALSELHFTKTAFFNEQIRLGGAIGHVIVSALKPLFHVTGTAVLLWSAFALIFIFYGPLVFSKNLWLFTKKFLIASLRAGKKFPHLFKFLSLKSKNLYAGIWTFSKMAFHFLKARLKQAKTAVFKKTAEVKSPTVEKDKEEAEPRFVFKETAEEKPLQPEGEKTLSQTKEQSPLPAEKNSQADEEHSAEKDQLNLKESLNIKKSFKKASSFFEIPSIDILSEPPVSSSKISRQDVEELSKKLTDKLSQFSINGEITAVKTGPALVLFEFKPEDHVKVSRIREMESDLSLALSSESVRIIAPIPGRDVVGIEASMPYREIVSLKNLLREKSFSSAELPLVLGRRADNVIGIRDLSRIPHLLVAGTTGSGKSMFIISFVTSLLFRHTPDTLRILLIDPKQVDLSAFKDIPHLLSPIITSTDETTKALHWAIMEMEKRYRSLAIFKARDQKSFNSIVANLSPAEQKQHAEKNEEAPPHESYYFEPMPLICIVIEEFGDLMADRNARRAIENAVVRLAQKARASGIHLVLAMQSPRKDVLTGLIKTNIPGRISFKVSSGTDSRVILDDNGAERLLSHGDMLFLEPGNVKPLRYHGPFVREKDVTEIGNYWRSYGEIAYEEALVNKEGQSHLGNGSFNQAVDVTDDPIFSKILEFVKSRNEISASYLQRRFQIGYPRAARIIEVLEEQGVIGPPRGSKPREVLIQK